MLLADPVWLRRVLRADCPTEMTGFEIAVMGLVSLVIFMPFAVFRTPPNPNFWVDPVAWLLSLSELLIIIGLLFVYGRHLAQVWLLTSRHSGSRPLERAWSARRLGRFGPFASCASAILLVATIRLGIPPSLLLVLWLFTGPPFGVFSFVGALATNAYVRGLSGQLGRARPNRTIRIRHRRVKDTSIYVFSQSVLWATAVVAFVWDLDAAVFTCACAALVALLTSPTTRLAENLASDVRAIFERAAKSAPAQGRVGSDHRTIECN